MEQIIGVLREAEVGLAEGKGVTERVRELGVTEQTYYRWRREYGGRPAGSTKSCSTSYVRTPSCPPAAGSLPSPRRPPGTRGT